MQVSRELLLLVDALARDNLRWVPFTQLANLTGTPAMSVAPATMRSPLASRDNALRK